jgi:hypothetical protein
MENRSKSLEDDAPALSMVLVAIMVEMDVSSRLIGVFIMHSDDAYVWTLVAVPLV